MAGAGMKDIKRRIKSVESTLQITKAMELVASSKMRRAKERAERTQPFFNILYDTLSDIAEKNRDMSSVYMQERKEKKAPAFLVIAGDRGLAGGYNSNVFKTAQNLIGKNPDAYVIPVGKKAMEHFSKREVQLLDFGCHSVEDLGMGGVFSIARQVCSLYRSGKIDELTIVYTNFVSVLSQSPASARILPVSVAPDAEKGREPGRIVDITYDPTAAEVFDRIVPQYVAGMIYGALAESFASEQGARRTAMESASDNATEMIDDLSLKYNRARQAAITQEITEIAAGAEALK